MGFELGIKRKLPELRRGDVINLRVPFEENTRDYYNGYKPEEMREKPFTDRFGNSSKKRMVVFVGCDGPDMLYLPITSKTGHPHDVHNQYELKDNSMLPSKDPNRRSFVELNSLRAIRISQQRELQYTGHLISEDICSILHRLCNNTLQFNSKRDQRGFIPPYMEKIFIKELLERGYRLDPKSTENRKIYRQIRTKQMVTRTKSGMVYYHYEMAKEDVLIMVSLREGRRTPDRNIQGKKFSTVPGKTKNPGMTQNKGKPVLKMQRKGDAPYDDTS